MKVIHEKFDREQADSIAQGEAHPPFCLYSFSISACCAAASAVIPPISLGRLLVWQTSMKESLMPPHSRHFRLKA